MNENAPKIGAPAEALSRALAQSKHVEAVVTECAVELPVVNGAVKQALAAVSAQPGIERVVEKSVAIEEKVQAASEDLAALNRSLQAEVRERTLVGHQLAAAEEQIQASYHAAFHDLLTGLPNRALFRDRLEHGCAEAKRHRWNLAVMFLDLDGFKFVNDSQGHEAGDGVLQVIARRLQENTRGEDTISRYGGDEFLCLLMEVRDAESVAMIAKKIIKAIQAPCSVSRGDAMIEAHIKASIGISLFPKDGTTADVLIRRADEAMYKAKQAHSGYCFAL